MNMIHQRELSDSQKRTIVLSGSFMQWRSCITRIADRHTGIRRVEICANRVVPENFVQYDLFSDPEQQEKERNLQLAILEIKRRYGRNAVMRGSNLLGLFYLQGKK